MLTLLPNPQSTLFTSALCCSCLGRWGKCLERRCHRLSSKESACQYRRHEFNSWVGKIPWRRKWQPTPVCLPGPPHGRRSLVGYSLWCCKELSMTERLSTHSRCLQFSSVHFSRLVVSDSLQPHESQHTRPPCPSPTPGVLSDSRPSSR